MNSAIDAVTTTLTANPGAAHWVFFSCNDDGVLGSVRATENSGMKPDQVIGVGIDGSRACDAFGGGQPTGFRGTLWIDSGKEGATAVKLLVASIKNNTPLPEKTPPSTYAPAFLALGITFLLFGVLSSYVFSAAGVALMAVSISKWVGELLHGE